MEDKKTINVNFCDFSDQSNPQATPVINILTAIGKGLYRQYIKHKLIQFFTFGQKRKDNCKKAQKLRNKIKDHKKLLK